MSNQGTVFAVIDSDPEVDFRLSNTSGLVPVGRAVLVEPYTPERQSSIIELPKSVETNQATLEQRAVVIEVGPACWKEEDEPRANPGDKVLISAYAGYMAVGPLDGKQYRFVNDRDIFAKIKETQP